MCIDKKLLFNFLFFMTFSLGAMAQVPSRDAQAFENPETNKVIKSVEIFPNPASEVLHVDVKEIAFNSIGFEMYNIIGSKIPVSYEQVNKSLYKIPVKDLANGYYMLIVKDSESRYRKAFKFMKI